MAYKENFRADLNRYYWYTVETKTHLVLTDMIQSNLFVNPVAFIDDVFH